MFLVGVELVSSFGARQKTSRSAESDNTDIPSPPASATRLARSGRVRLAARVARDAASAHVRGAASGFPGQDLLAELRELARSAGVEIAGEIVQRRERPDSATLMGSGKLEELQGAMASSSRSRPGDSRS